MRRGRIDSGFSRRFGAGLAAFGLAILSSVAPSLAGIIEGIVVDHEPAFTGGPASDTAFTGGIVPWQRVADDFMLGDPAELRMVRWWGYYVENVAPTPETMRVRFLGARPSDGLPDETNILHEEEFLNPSRMATGNTVFGNVIADEYAFEVDLNSALALEASTPYWLEIVQVGNVDSEFAWEFSTTDLNSHSFINPLTIDWQAAAPLVSDMAFQLSTIPEPTTLWLTAAALLGILCLRRRRRRSHT